MWVSSKIVHILFNAVVHSKGPDPSKNVIPLWDFWSCLLVDQNSRAIGFYYSQNPLEGSTEHIQDLPQLHPTGKRADECNDLEHHVCSKELPAHLSASNVRGPRSKQW